MLRRTLLDLDDKFRAGRVLSQSSTCHIAVAQPPLGAAFTYDDVRTLFTMTHTFGTSFGFLGVSQDLFSFGSLLYELSQR